MINPREVVAPKDRWSLIDVLADDIKSKGGQSSSLVIGTWINRKKQKQIVLALRWNGDDEERLGSPTSRGNATWFIVNDQLNDAILSMSSLSPEKVQLAKTLLATSVY